MSTINLLCIKLCPTLLILYLSIYSIAWLSIEISTMKLKWTINSAKRLLNYIYPECAVNRQCHTVSVRLNLQHLHYYHELINSFLSLILLILTPSLSFLTFCYCACKRVDFNRFLHGLPKKIPIPYCNVPTQRFNVLFVNNIYWIE